MNEIIVPVLVLGVIALIASVLLYVLSKKFAVEEDARLPLIIEALPGANCGGCGFPGCAGLANALIKGSNAGSIDGLSCPVGGEDTMSKIVDLLGAAAANPAPAEKPAAKAESGAKKSFKPAPVEKAFVPTAVPTVKPCDKPVNMPAGCKPADVKSLKTI
ncbi:hypothetical protein E5358_02915 [Palleniella muris]|uniref:Uncharacterized protein n=1 Tax=Palleniella muris TaxID=3038145 RepID=A0AC61QT43_9BACT|nr:hypothetical protein E5358_02915 [Palleniella muris]